MHVPTNSAIFTARINENIYTFERKRERGVYRHTEIYYKERHEEYITSDIRTYTLVSLK